MFTLNTWTTCRTCLENSKGSTTTIYDKINESTSIVNLLQDYSFIKISEFEDKFPRMICNACYEKIKICHEFQLLCEKSENIILNFEENSTQSSESTAKTEPIHQEIPYSTITCEDDIKEENFYDEEVEHEITSEEENRIENFDSFESESEIEIQYIIDTDQAEAELNDTYADDYLYWASKKYYKFNKVVKSAKKLVENDENRTICLACNSEFRSDKLFFGHSIVNHENRRIFKCKTYTIDSVLIREAYYCIKCKTVFYSRKKFISHLINKDKREPYECPDCGDILENSETYRDHLSNCYKEILRCSICDINFPTKNSYSLHKEKVTHIKDIILCHFCGIFHKKKSNHTSHLRIHTGEKPYKCNICGKAFGQITSLKNHKDFNHNEERNHVCFRCGATFKSRIPLRTHLKIHMGVKKHKCNICGYKFLHLHDLKNHYLVHSDERKEICTICNKRYKRKSGLNFHMKIHTGKNMNKCPICDKSFTQKVCLQNHIKKHHSVDEAN